MAADHLGAEACITFDPPHAIKTRKPKQYRHTTIDTRLRQERTEKEARLLEKAAQAGVAVPTVVKQEKTELVMDLIDGEKLRDIFEERDDLWTAVGENIARLHAQDIIHGDLTTSNILVKGGELYFIDFGLGFFSQRVEDRATDLRLLEQVLQSTHYKVAEEAFQAILDGYSEGYGGSDEVLEQLEEVKSRRRYS